MGVSTLIAMSPVALKVLHLLGGAYLLKMGWDCLRAEASSAPELDQKNKMASTYYQRALMSNLLNPKALVFFCDVFASVRFEQYYRFIRRADAGAWFVVERSWPFVQPVIGSVGWYIRERVAGE